MYSTREFLLHAHIDAKTLRAWITAGWMLPQRDGDVEGFSEIDQAIRENRLTEYRMKKAWADPINRWITLLVALILLAFVAFVVINDVIL